MSEVDHASNWDRLIFALELAVNSEINMELTTSQCKYLLDKLTSLTDRVADLEAERSWIPVSERLPEKKGEYLTVTEGARNPYGDVSIWVEPVEFYSECGHWGCGIDRFVTHWMPLPPPPEEK